MDSWADLQVGFYRLLLLLRLLSRSLSPPVEKYQLIIVSLLSVKAIFVIKSNCETVRYNDRVHPECIKRFISVTFLYVNSVYRKWASEDHLRNFSFRNFRINSIVSAFYGFNKTILYTISSLTIAICKTKNSSPRRSIWKVGYRYPTRDADTR